MVHYLSRDDIQLPARDLGSHKGQNGRVLVVGGSEEYSGAVSLAALAAYRTGADLVRIVVPEIVVDAIRSSSPDLIVSGVKGKHFERDHIPKIVTMMGDADVVILGNGLGQHPSTMKFVAELLNQYSSKKGPAWVIDADALKALGGSEVHPHQSILTPHQGELRIMLSNASLDLSLSGNVEKDATSLQEAFQELFDRNNILLLKGRIDIILSKQEHAFNSTGNPGMTVGGTGDVLAGICAGLVSQGMPLFQAACSAAFISGYVGDRLYDSNGYGFIASDFFERLPSVLKDLWP